jgi:hypothetical protein
MSTGPTHNGMRDIEIIIRNADRLNAEAEAEDVVRYQAPWDIDDEEARHLVKKKNRKQ